MNPYLSIVCGIGGVVTEDLIQRLVDSSTNTAALAQDCKVSCEILIVEWNMPKDNPLEGFSFFRDSRLEMPVRRINTGDVHDRYPNPYGFKYFEMAPKNIGIRRSHGEFVLSTNPDAIFDRGMFELFSRRNLEHGCFYRANRHDTRDGRVYRVCRATGCYPPEATEEQTRVSQPGAAPWSENMLHYNASGTFVLMAKDDWFKIHGNPERDYNSSVDGQTVWLAHTKGLKQIVLPQPYYHEDHERTLNIAGDGKLFTGPPWEDTHPHTKENGEDWGHAGIEFEETLL